MTADAASTRRARRRPPRPRAGAVHAAALAPARLRARASGACACAPRSTSASLDECRAARRCARVGARTPTARRCPSPACCRTLIEFGGGAVTAQLRRARCAEHRPASRCRDRTRSVDGPVRRAGRPDAATERRVRRIAGRRRGSASTSRRPQCRARGIAERRTPPTSRRPSGSGWTGSPSCPRVRADLQQMTAFCWWVLGANIVELPALGRARAVVPSKIGYVGLWQWDAYFIAVGLRHGDPELAREQLAARLPLPERRRPAARRRARARHPRHERRPAAGRPRDAAPRRVGDRRPVGARCR